MTTMRKGILHVGYRLERLWTLSWGINSQSDVGWGNIQFLPNGWITNVIFFGQNIYKLDILGEYKRISEKYLFGITTKVVTKQNKKTKKIKCAISITGNKAKV